MHPTVTLDPTSNTYTITTADGSETRTYKPITEEDIQKDTKFEEALRDFEVAKGLAQQDGVLTTDNVYGYHDSDGTWHFFVPDDLENPKDYTSQMTTYTQRKSS